MRRLFEFAIRLRLMVLMLTGCTLWAQEPVKRLESVRIDPQELKLTWTVTEGTEDADDKFTATAWREFSIDLDKATMEELTLAQSDAFREFPKHNRKTDEVREFTQREADSVLRLVAILARYAADSTEWWDLGMGRKKPEGRIAKRQMEGGAECWAGKNERGKDLWMPCLPVSGDHATIWRDGSGRIHREPNGPTGDFRDTFCEERRSPGMTSERCYAIEGEFGYPSDPVSELGWTPAEPVKPEGQIAEKLPEGVMRKQDLPYPPGSFLLPAMRRVPGTPMMVEVNSLPETN